MKFDSPSIVKCAERLLLEIERSVSAFPRRHKYLLGNDLRKVAVEVLLLAQEAYRASKEKVEQAGLVRTLIRRVDTLKIHLQASHQLQCFPSFGRFEEVARIAADLGRQCGGWIRKIREHLQGQNPVAVRPLERASTLSTRAAPTGANV